MNWTQDGLAETRSPVTGSLGELKTAGSLGFTLNANVVPLPAVPRRFFAAGVSGGRAPYLLSDKLIDPGTRILLDVSRLHGDALALGSHTHPSVSSGDFLVITADRPPRREPDVPTPPSTAHEIHHHRRPSSLPWSSPCPWDGESFNNRLHVNFHIKLETVDQTDRHTVQVSRNHDPLMHTTFINNNVRPASKLQAGRFWVQVIAMIFLTATVTPSFAEPNQKGQQVAKQTATKNITQCPDCTEKVSKRAMMCPHCGCPGDAIKLAVHKAEQAAKPKSVVRVVSDFAKGHGVAVKDGDATYVVFDAFLLGDSTKLELHDVRDDKMLSYTQVQLADKQGLLRLKVTSDQVVFKPLAPPGSNPAIYLDAQGFRAGIKQGVASLANPDQVCGLVQGQTTYPLHAGMRWKSVMPKQLRQQLNLLSRLKSQKAKGHQPLMTTAEASTKWLTSYFAKLAKELTQ